MKRPGPEQELKAQLAGELCSILRGWQRDVGAAMVDMHASDLSRLRHGDLRRFSLTRLIRYIARAGYDIEIHLKKSPAPGTPSQTAAADEHRRAIQLFR